MSEREEGFREGVEAAATKGVDAILHDIFDRRGFKQVFADCDDEIQDEIVASCRAYIRALTPPTDGAEALGGISCRPLRRPSLRKGPDMTAPSETLQPWCDCATRYGSRDVTYYCHPKEGFKCRKPNNLAFAIKTSSRIAELETTLNESRAECERLRNDMKAALKAECERLRREVP